MSFTFRGQPSDGFGIATLQRLPSLQGLQLETLEAPGTDGLFFGGSTLSSAGFVFDTIIKGSSPADAHAKRDALTLVLDPARGEDWLTFDAAPDWRWWAIPSRVIEWERLTWDTALGFQFRADITFAALEAFGRLVNDEEWTRGSPGSLAIERQHGNARSFPTIELVGTLNASQSVTVSVAGVSCTVQGPLTPSQVLRLDYDRFEFARWNGATKVASVVRKMSNLARPVLWPHAPTTLTVSTTGSITSVKLKANSRRQ